MSKAIEKAKPAPLARTSKSKILNYTTEVEAEQTILEIQRILVSHGATGVLQQFKDGEVAAFEFSIPTPWGEMHYRLPINVEGTYGVMQEQAARKDKPLDRRYVNEAQARRVSWRINKDALEAMLALVQTEQVQFDQLMMPYEIQADRRTLYEFLVERRLELPAARQNYKALMPEAEATE